MIKLINSESLEYLEVGQSDWSIIVGGDCSPLHEFGTALSAGSPERILDQGIMDILSRATFTLVNLETPLYKGESPIQKTGPCFKASPAVAMGLKAAGVKGVSLANNHIMDHGIDGLVETIKAIENAGIRHHGAGLSGDAAERPLELEFANSKVAFLNIAEGEFARSHDGGSGAAPFDLPRNIEAIRRAAQTHDTVIVSVHAGNEFQMFPSPRLQQSYRAFIDAGACLVIGHHPHITQGVEQYSGGLILYSLGNFIFDYKPHSGILGWLKHTIKNRKINFVRGGTMVNFLAEIHFKDHKPVAYRVYPFKNENNKKIVLLRGHAKEQFVQNYLYAVSRPLTEAKLLTSFWEQEVVVLFDEYQRLIKKCLRILVGNDSQRKKKAAYTIGNLRQCPSHRDVLQTALSLASEGRLENDIKIQKEILKLRTILFSL